MEELDIKKLGTLIEVLTHSGANTLDEEIFKQVKKICKTSQAYIPHVYNLILKHLKKNNSQIRFIAFQICKELFSRSCLFRERVINDLNLIFELTTEINSSKKLPPPKSSAKSLKNLAISTLKAWTDQYGDTYRKLKVAYNYFKNCKQVNFETLEVGNSVEQIVENEQQRHQRLLSEERIKKVLDEFKSNESEIGTTITTLSNCLSLLLPPVEDFFIPDHNLEEISSTQTDNSASNSNVDTKNSINKPSGSDHRYNEEDESYTLAHKHNLREFGVSLDYNLTVHINGSEKFAVSKTEENSAIIENAKDCVRLINNRFLPMVKKWIKIFCKHSDSNNNEVKMIINLKEKLDNILKKFNSLNIEGESNNTDNANSSDDEDDDFEEVKKEGYEEGVDEVAMMKELLGFSKKETKSDTLSASQTVKSSEELCQPSTSRQSTSSSSVSDRKSKLLAVAPKLPFDIDLYHWEDEDLKPPTLISTKIDVDKFWGAPGSDDIHEIPNPEGVSALRTRVIEFSGTFEPVKWSCRAPLPNGTLCPRKDRFKCPFHGKIVARDEMGNIQNQEDLKVSEQKMGENSAVPDWQDPELLNEIKTATGIDLKIPDKKGKKGKINLTHKKMRTSAQALKILERKKLPGLVDVVKKQNNSYTRLSKKIFNRSAVRRVSSVLNKIDRNKFRDKFGDQFNYF